MEIIDLRVVRNRYVPHRQLAAAAANEFTHLRPPQLLRSYVSWINTYSAIEPRFHAINNIIGIAADRGRILNARVILIFPPMAGVICYAVNELLITHGARAKLQKHGYKYILWCSFNGMEVAATAAQVLDGLVRTHVWLRKQLYKPPSLILFTTFYFEDLNLTFS